jgi:AraC-like DNA-binding protein
MPLLSPDRSTVPIAHALALLRLIAARSSLPAGALEDLEQQWVCGSELGAVSLRLDSLLCAHAEHLQAPELGHVAGRTASVAEHGILGFALMSCPTLGDALSLWARFAPSLAGGFEVRRSEVPGGAEWTIQDLYPWLPGRAFSFDRFVAFMLGVCEQLANTSFKTMTLHLPACALARADEASRHHTMPTLSGSSEQARLITLTVDLAAPVVTSRPRVLGSLLRKCEQEHARIWQVRDWTARVECVLERRMATPISLEAVAKVLCVSTRTLKRRLQEEGTSYRALTDNLRKREAVRRMCNPSLPIEDVASIIGYTDRANFARAFRRWTGNAPGSYRTQSGNGLPAEDDQDVL